VKIRNIIADSSSGTVMHIHCEVYTSFPFQSTDPHYLKFAVEFLRHTHGNILHCSMIIFHGYLLSDSDFFLFFMRFTPETT